MQGCAGLQAPLSPHLADFDPSGSAEEKDALYLIREEIAIMKKLNHPNLVQLIEVLDDPEEDSLYIVLEMCKKGVVMKVGLDNQATPYSEDSCKTWFRDLILGIEYREWSKIMMVPRQEGELVRKKLTFIKSTPRASSTGISSQTTCFVPTTTSSRLSTLACRRCSKRRGR